jgi:hypothetical protein
MEIQWIRVFLWREKYYENLGCIPVPSQLNLSDIWYERAVRSHSACTMSNRLGLGWSTRYGRAVRWDPLVPMLGKLTITFQRVDVFIVEAVRAHGTVGPDRTDGRKSHCLH